MATMHFAKFHTSLIFSIEPCLFPIDIASPRFFSRHDPSDETAIAKLFGDKTVDEFPEEEEEEDDPRLMYLDPKDWKVSPIDCFSCHCCNWNLSILIT
jgi:hypothetical protein